MNKFIPTSCYVVNFYLGERRKMLESCREDKFYLLKTQIKHLEEVKHSLDKIIFNFNVDIDHYSYLTEVYKITPKKIKDTEVEIIIRENKGISYGAWSDVFGKYQLTTRDSRLYSGYILVMCHYYLGIIDLLQYELLLLLRSIYIITCMFTPSYKLG